MQGFGAWLWGTSVAGLISLETNKSRAAGLVQKRGCPGLHIAGAVARYKAGEPCDATLPFYS